MKNDCDGSIAFCPVETGIAILAGKWKGRILWKLHTNSVMRFGELRRALGKITEKMLSQQLRELESGLLSERFTPRSRPASIIV